mmetsp:Transcript_10147/g.24152  ORF Transcript_10147/g.24152 Transcript_10147/m.24152 type:complete len:290 (+) Transcript_10147:176-1045(+)
MPLDSKAWASSTEIFLDELITIVFEVLASNIADMFFTEDTGLGTRGSALATIVAGCSTEAENSWLVKALRSMATLLSGFGGGAASSGSASPTFSPSTKVSATSSMTATSSPAADAEARDSRSSQKLIVGLSGCGSGALGLGLGGPAGVPWPSGPSSRGGSGSGVPTQGFGVGEAGLVPASGCAWASDTGLASWQAVFGLSGLLRCSRAGVVSGALSLPLGLGARWGVQGAGFSPASSRNSGSGASADGALARLGGLKTAGLGLDCTRKSTAGTSSSGCPALGACSCTTS